MTSPLWLGDGRDEWLKEVSDWLGDVVWALGLGSLVEITSVRERLWGAVLRVRTSDRVVYFKAEGLGAHHEPQILGALAPAWPDLVPEVLEADGPRRWLLMADHGRPMWDVLDTAEQVAAFERLLPQYAELQASSSRSVEVWMEAGAPDRRVHRLPELLEAWSGAGSSPATWRETFTLALWAGHVSRALAFAHMLDGATPVLIEQWQGHIVVVLRHWKEAHARLNRDDEFLLAIHP